MVLLLYDNAQPAVERTPYRLELLARCAEHQVRIDKKKFLHLTRHKKMVSPILISLPFFSGFPTVARDEGAEPKDSPKIKKILCYRVSILAREW